MQHTNDDSDRIKIACLLIDRKANIQTTNKSGKTPLQVCRSQRVKDAVETYIRQRCVCLHVEQTDQNMH